jgi:spore maturation protein CgeB
MNKLKNLLKKNYIFNNINAYIKCYFQKNQYINNVKYYSNLAPKNSFEDLMILRGFTTEWSESTPIKDMHVYFIGTDFNQDHGGFIQSLKSFVKVTLFYKYDNTYGQYDPRSTYQGVTGRELNTKKIIEDVNLMVNQGNSPDIILMQSLGANFNVDCILDLKNKHQLKFINICLDDRLAFKLKTPKNEKYNYGAIGLTSLVDLALVANPEVVEWYIKEDVPAIHFPMASSLDFYHPMNIDKKFDVGFIGGKYGYREKLVNALRKAGINVCAHGDNWEKKKLSLEENNKFLNECKIVLGIGTVGHCSDFYTSKLRDFEVPLSGSVYVTHNNEDLLKYYKNNEIVLCDTEDDFIQSIKHLLSNDKKMHELRARAFNTAKKEHTYEVRFISLFTLLGSMNSN